MKLFIRNSSGGQRPRPGKFLEWDHILDCLYVRGDEIAIDRECGPGVVLTAVARGWTAGSVTGVDILEHLGSVG